MHDVLKVTSGEIDLIKCFATVMFACSSSVVRSEGSFWRCQNLSNVPTPKFPNASIHEQDTNFHMDVKITMKGTSFRYICFDYDRSYWRYEFRFVSFCNPSLLVRRPHPSIRWNSTALSLLTAVIQHSGIENLCLGGDGMGKNMEPASLGWCSSHICDSYTLF